MARRFKLTIAEILKEPRQLDGDREHSWSAEASYHRADQSWWVGRELPCGFVVAHPTVSAVHFIVRPEAGDMLLESLSKYGTEVDGQLIPEGEQILLKARCSIRAGAVWLRGEIVEIAAPTSDARRPPSEDDVWAGMVIDDDPWDWDDAPAQPQPSPASSHPSSAGRSDRPAHTTDPGLRRPVAPAGPADPILDRILGAAGLTAEARQQAAQYVTPEDIGSLLAAWIRGARSVQFAKKEVKDNANLETTQTLDGTINPLTREIPPEEILRLLLGFEGPLYARGQEAVRQWFGSLAAHELAIPDAVRDAWLEHAREFSPETFENGAGKGGLMSRLSSSMRDAQAWQRYRAHYQKHFDDLQAAYRRRFLKRFADAYSRHLGKSDKGSRRR